MLRRVEILTISGVATQEAAASLEMRTAKDRDTLIEQSKILIEQSKILIEQSFNTTIE